MLAPSSFEATASLFSRKIFKGRIPKENLWGMKGKARRHDMTEENGEREEWVFDDTKACAKALRERRRLIKVRTERTTAKERLKSAHRDIELAMSAPLGVKRRRLARMREYAIEVKLGVQQDLTLGAAPGTCCPDADCRYERWDTRRCSQCGRMCTESCPALAGRREER